MKKIVFTLTGLILLSAMGFNIYQYQRNKNLSENTARAAAAQKEPETSRMDMAEKNTSGTEDNTAVIKLEEELNDTEKELDRVNEQLAEELDKKEAFDEGRAKMQELTRERIKKWRLESIDSDYALLYDHLGLTPEQHEKFNSIVGDWRIDHIDNTVPLIMAATTDEEKAEVYRRSQLMREKYKEQFIELMGEEKYNIYNSYRKSLFERDAVDRFIQALPSENKIDNDVRFDLISRMAEERTALEKKYGFYDLITFPSDNRADRAEEETEMAEQVYDRYTEIGNEMLAPEQAEQYEKYIEVERKRYLSQIKSGSY